MGKFIEVYRNGYLYKHSVLVNVNTIRMVKQYGDDELAVLILDNDVEMILDHTYTEVCDTLAFGNGNKVVPIPIASDKLQEK